MADTVVVESLRRGEPGRYVARMKIDGARIDEPKRQFFDPTYWDRAFAAKGVNARCVSVTYVTTGNGRSVNPFDIFNWTGTGLTGLVDVYYDVVFDYAGDPSTGLSGLGAVQGVVIAVAIIAALTLGFKLYCDASPGNCPHGNPVIETIKQLAAAPLEGLGAGLPALAVGLLVVAGVLILFKKGGGRVNTKWGGIG